MRGRSESEQAVGRVASRRLQEVAQAYASGQVAARLGPPLRGKQHGGQALSCHSVHVLPPPTRAMLWALLKTLPTLPKTRQTIAKTSTATTAEEACQPPNFNGNSVFSIADSSIWPGVQSNCSCLSSPDVSTSCSQYADDAWTSFSSPCCRTSP